MTVKTSPYSTNFQKKKNAKFKGIEQEYIEKLNKKINEINSVIQAEIRRRENNIFSQERNLQEVVFNRIYERNTSETVCNMHKIETRLQIFNLNFEYKD